MLIHTRFVGHGLAREPPFNVKEPHEHPSRQLSSLSAMARMAERSIATSGDDVQQLWPAANGHSPDASLSVVPKLASALH